MDGEAAVGSPAGVEATAVERDALAHADETVAAARGACGPPGPVVDDLELERVGAVADVNLGVSVAGVLERVRQRLLDDPVGRELDPGRQRAALALDARARRGGRPRASASRAPARRRDRAAATASRRASLRSIPTSRRISVSAPRPICSIVSSTSRVEACSSSRTRRSAPAWTTIIETLWAITSCSSRAIRARSSTTASRAATSRSRSAIRARRSRSPTTRRTSSITTDEITMNGTRVLQAVLAAAVRAEREQRERERRARVDGEADREHARSASTPRTRTCCRSTRSRSSPRPRARTSAARPTESAEPIPTTAGYLRRNATATVVATPPIDTAIRCPSAFPPSQVSSRSATVRTAASSRSNLTGSGLKRRSRSRMRQR